MNIIGITDTTFLLRSNFKKFSGKTGILVAWILIFCQFNLVLFKILDEKKLRLQEESL